MFRACQRILNLKRLHSTCPQVFYRPDSPVNTALKYNVGEKLLGYTIKQVEEVPELQLAAVRLTHDKTGADHLHIARDDKNNFFSVGMRTTPRDSSGIMHILEHISLSGSQKYPIRDVFQKMRTRSLSTFMNAFTGSDYTMYPFSTQNPKDFENLLHIYLDAVFFPCLREEDFMAEGWRLEHKDINDVNSPIELKGVVFNEMKGVFSDSSQIYGRYLMNKMFPNSYPHESGGDPLKIPDLTWNALKQYHSEFYHPSNSRFYTYGDQPLESHLQSIEDYVLTKFPKCNMNTAVQHEQQWKEPRQEHITCQFDPLAAIPDKQTTVSLSYMLNDCTDTFETFAVAIVGSLLIDGANAPFYNALIEPQIGSDYSPWSGYLGFLKTGFFSVGLREIAKNDVDRVKYIIETTISNVVKNGFAKERIEGVLHNIELGVKHQTSNFGYSCVMGLSNNWNHGGDPITSLKVNEHVEWFKNQLKNNPRFLQEKVNQYFKENTHKLCLTMSPDENYETELKAAEQKLLESKVHLLTEADKKVLFNKGLELEESRKKKEDVSCLPTLKITEVQRQMEKTDLQFESIGNVSIQLCEQPTNGITYFRAFLKLPELSDDLLQLLPIFTDIVTKMGAGEHDFKSLEQLIELKTGGLSACVHVSDNPSVADDFQLGVLFTSHCLQRNVDEMMRLWSEVFNRLTLSDKQRLSQMIKMSAAELAQSIPQVGHRYSMGKASSFLNFREQLGEKLSGLSQVSFMKKLAEMNDYDEIIEKFKFLASLSLNRNNMKCSINANAEGMSSSVSSVKNFINSLNTTVPSVQSQWTALKPQINKYHFVLPFNVNYLGKCIATVPYNHQEFASMRVVSKLLSSKFLHTEIREKGGAYGGGSTVNQRGVFAFYSYRDPQLSDTLKCFDDSSQWLLDGNYSNEDIDEAKLGVFSEVDYPVAPGSKGSSQFLHGVTYDMRQTLRERLFSVTKETIIAASQRYLCKNEISGTALIGPEQEVTKNSSDWFVHREQDQ